jgi:RND superfamily putative drug exporter
MDSVQVAGTPTRDFPARPDTWAYEQVSATRGRTLDQADLTQYLVRLSKVAGTSVVMGSDGTFQAGLEVQSPAPAPAVRGESTWIGLVPDAHGGGTAWLSGLRAVPSPFVVRFAGPAAELSDTLDELASGLPYALALVSLSVLILLWLLTGSVLLPIKALVLKDSPCARYSGRASW